MRVQKAHTKGVVFPNDAEQWVGKIVVLDWQMSFAANMRKIPTNSGGRVLRVDETYLTLQPFGLTEPTVEGEAVTKLGFKATEELIPLVDIDAIYAAPLDGIQILE